MNRYYDMPAGTGVCSSYVDMSLRSRIDRPAVMIPCEVDGSKALFVYPLSELPERVLSNYEHTLEGYVGLLVEACERAYEFTNQEEQ